MRINFGRTENTSVYKAENNIKKHDTQVDIKTNADEDEYISTAKEIDKSLQKISRWRIVTGRLTDKQIETINSLRRVPENATIVTGGMGSYSVAIKEWAGKSPVRELPEGYIIRKNKRGIAEIVPEDPNKNFFLS